MKKFLVADILHYPISLTEIEKAIIATPIFNRLHNVKQNSTAYLTFPSLGHSRFPHSLGVMHLTGQLFSSALSNAEEKHRKTFLHSVAQILQALVLERFDADRFKSLVAFRFDNIASRTPSEIARRAPALAEHIPYSLTPLEQFCYLVTVQAIRLGALVHDLGHPPFSHVTEEAISAIKAQLKARGSHDALNERERACLSALTGKKAGHTGTKQLHEHLTKELFSQLVEEVRETTIDKFKDPGEIASWWLATEFSELISSNDFANDWGLNLTDEHRTVLKRLNELFSGKLDGDRLDYVQRDIVLSGIRTDAYRPQRLIELFELCYDDAPGASKELLFLPNIRSIRSLEEFFAARYDLYRHVLFHHHVVKTDGLLREIVTKLALSWLSANKSNGEHIPRENHSELSSSPDNIEWLWQVFAENKGTTRDLRNDLYLQWDDHWLMSLLRACYIDLRKKPTPLSAEQEILLKQLEDLVASKKNYFSLVKRSEDFIEIDDAFTKHLTSRSGVESIEHLLIASSRSAFLQRGNAKKQINSTSGNNQNNKILPQAEEMIAWFISKLKENDNGKNPNRSLGVVAAANALLAGMEIGGAWSLQESVRTRFIETCDLRDVLFVDKTSKMTDAGFDETFKIRTSNGVGFFSAFSNLARELLGRAQSYPGFFAFILPKFGAQQLTKQALREKLGTLLAEEFLSIQNKMKGESA